MAFCHRLLADTGVATAPGIDFDTAAGNRFVRFSFAGTPEDATEALRRMEAWLARGA
jgi:aspartate/methionine/tyrosine aminotransferase